MFVGSSDEIALTSIAAVATGGPQPGSDLNTAVGQPGVGVTGHKGDGLMCANPEVPQ